MIATHSGENSESSLMNQLYMLADAGASLIQVRTREPIRTALVLRKSILTSENSAYKEWDTINGFRNFTQENFTDNRLSGDGMDFSEGLGFPLSELRKPTSEVNAKSDHIHYFAFINPHPFIKGNPYVIELLQHLAAILPMSNVCVILVTPDISFDDVPVGTVLITDMPTPSTAELESVLTRIIDNAKDDFDEGSALDEDDIRRIALLGLGLTLYEFETYAAISIIAANINKEVQITPERMMEGISEGKMAIIKQSEILELYPTESMENVGGMQRLKDWVDSRSGCYSDEAKEFGIEPPKGAVLVGVPGAGKSLASKAVANVLQVPLVRMDFSRIFSKYIGDSESRVRSALSMVESMAPCVLFVDEIDKGLGGIGSGGDSGTSSRVLGSFLTWLQECKAPVFVMVTANRVSGLPPELLRRGRFDAIFSVTLPTEPERMEVLNIHLRKRGHGDKKFTAIEQRLFFEASKNYVPAEIESAVKDALIAAFNLGETLQMQHVVDALHEMVPMSKSYKAQIDEIVAWAKDNATPVNYTENESPAMNVARRVGRRIRGS